MILFDAGGGTEVIGGVIRVSPDCSSQFPVLSSQWDSTAVRFGGEEKASPQGHRGARGRHREVLGKKNAGLKAATLISVSNPVSQVLW
jgi:hypothetical protein